MTFDVILQLLGRAHPMVLHLPIGLLAGLAALEAITLVRPRTNREAHRLLALLVGISAVIAAASGLLLAREGGHPPGALDQHKWLGIAVAAASVLLALLYQRTSDPSKRAAVWSARATLVGALLLLIPAGHIGASMTHGSGFLTEPLARAAAPEPAQTVAIVEVSADAVHPVLIARCVSCHGAERQKARLRLDSRSAILAGGSSGPAMVENDPDASEIIRRMRLTVDDDGHMPPVSKQQPTAEDIDAVAAWISGAALPDVSLAAAVPAAPSIAPPPADAIAALRAAHINVTPVEPESNIISIDVAAVAMTFDDEAAKRLLGPVAANIGELSLARSPVSDVTLELVRGMPKLRRLDLHETKITSAGIAHLSESSSLEWLNIARTPVADDVIDALVSMTALRTLHAWSSAITGAGVERLHAARAEVVVEGVSDRVVAAPEAEAPVVFTSDAAVPGAPAAPVGGAPAVAVVAASLAATNTTCPVTGSPVNPKFTIVHEGKAIGFCCPNCPKEFWSDPAKYVK